MKLQKVNNKNTVMETSKIVVLERNELESVNGGIIGNILMYYYFEALIGAYQRGYNEGLKDK
jgi:hypothetical protein